MSRTECREPLGTPLALSLHQLQVWGFLHLLSVVSAMGQTMDFQMKDETLVHLVHIREIEKMVWIFCLVAHIGVI